MIDLAKTLIAGQNSFRQHRAQLPQLALNGALVLLGLLGLAWTGLRPQLPPSWDRGLVIAALCCAAIISSAMQTRHDWQSKRLAQTTDFLAVLPLSPYDRIRHTRLLLLSRQGLTMLAWLGLLGLLRSDWASWTLTLLGMILVMPLAWHAEPTASTRLSSDHKVAARDRQPWRGYWRGFQWSSTKRAWLGLVPMLMIPGGMAPIGVLLSGAGLIAVLWCLDQLRAVTEGAKAIHGLSAPLPLPYSTWVMSAIRYVLVGVWVLSLLAAFTLTLTANWMIGALAIVVVWVLAVTSVLLSFACRNLNEFGAARWKLLVWFGLMLALVQMPLLLIALPALWLKLYRTGNFSGASRDSSTFHEPIRP